MKFNVAMFGGTFDPIHYGHIKTLNHVESTFHFDGIEVVPCKIPLLKDEAQAKPQDRVEMLKIAFEDAPHIHINRIEIDRKSPSYTLETLQSLQNKWQQSAKLTLIIGYDAFLNFNQWYQPQAILNLCNILVLHRKSEDEKHASAHILQLLKRHEVKKIKDFEQQISGAILMFDAGSYPISSTLIRDHIKKGKPIENWLPPKVETFIKDRGLYL